MSEVRLGIIGVGAMGSVHAGYVQAGRVARCTLAAVCDSDPRQLVPFADLPRFERSADLIRSGLVDAVLVATPHYDHVPIGIDALSQGRHLLVEKPIAVHKADALRLLAAHTNPRQVFGAMLNQRSDPYYQKVRSLVRGGDLGELRRIQWTITDWFRTEAYYASGGWRATWAGEGGGVLLNQATHNLDLFQWLFGMPARVRATCGFGRYHDIEVEDDVTAVLEFPTGATAVFITSTGETPGSNRLEVIAERGRLVYEADRLVWDRNDAPMTEFSRSAAQSYTQPAQARAEFRFPDHGGQHVALLQGFVDAVLDGQPLLAPGAEGLGAVELANAMLLSAWAGRTVALPLDEADYERRLKELIRQSRYVKPALRPRGHEVAPYLANT
jgi:predicted dehydrogenase